MLIELKLNFKGMVLSYLDELKGLLYIIGKL
jgi:hypothetical protein